MEITKKLLPPPICTWKKLQLIIVSVMLSQFAYCQTPNSIPSSGNVGIGTTNPTSKLQVKGSVRIDSSLTVKKSMVVQKNTQLNGTLKVSSTFSLPNLVDTSYSSNTVLMLNENGDVVNGGTLRDQVYTVETPTYPGNNCPTDMNGNVLYSSPYWEHENQGMFLIDEACTYSPRLGIGVKPNAKVHIRAKESDGITPFLVDYKLMNGAGIKKLLQLDTSGLLHAREVVVDAQQWADFVFHETYQLQPIEDLADFISKHQHLPGVPTAKIIQEQGINVAQNAKITLQKIEELTLYTIQQHRKIKAQQHTISALEKRLSTLESQLQTVVKQLAKSTHK